MNTTAALAHPELNPWESSRQGRVLETFEIDSWEIEMARNIADNCAGSRKDHFQYLVNAHKDYIFALRTLRRQAKGTQQDSVVQRLRAAEDARNQATVTFQKEMVSERNKISLSSSERRMIAKAEQKNKASKKFKESQACPYVKAGIEVGVGAACTYVGGPWLGAGCAIGAAGALDGFCLARSAHVPSPSNSGH